MSINRQYVKVTSEKLRRIFRSLKIRSTYQTENTLRKLLCKPKDRVATEDQKNIVCEIECSNCEVAYFGKSKRSLKFPSDEHRGYVRNCNSERSKTAKNCLEADRNFSLYQKNVVDRESKLIPLKIKETIYSLRILITLTKFPACFLKYGFLICGISELLYLRRF